MTVSAADVEFLGNWRGPRGVRGARGEQGLPGVLATSEDAAIAAAVSAESSATAAALRDAFGLVNVKAFGAVGTGLVDDSWAIQEALDASAGTGWTVFVPRGTYRLDEVLLFRHDGLRFRASDEATFLKFHGSAMILNGNVGESVAGADDLVIEGGRWDLRGEVNRTYGGVISLGDCDGFHIRRMVMLNNFQNHNIEIAGCSNGVVEDIDHQGVYFADTDHYYVEAVQVEAMTAAGFPRFNLDSKKPTTNVIFRRHRQVAPVGTQKAWPVGIGSHSGTPAGAQPIRDITIEACDFGDCTYTVIRPREWVNTALIGVRGNAPTGLFLEGKTGAAYSLTARNCVITGTTRAARILNTDDVTLTDCNLSGSIGATIEGSTNVTIGPGNRIRSTEFDALSIQNNSADAGRQNTGIRIMGNSIIGKRYGVQAYSTTYGRTTGVSMSSNTIGGTGGSAINLIGAVGVVIAGNNIIGSGGTGPVVADSSNSNGVSITGNSYPYGKTLTNGSQPQFEVGQNVAVNIA